MRIPLDVTFSLVVFKILFIFNFSILLILYIEVDIFE